MAERGPSRKLSVFLLGDFQVLYGERPVNSVNTPRLQALLAYLILHRHAPQSRRHLSFLFWPDSTEAQARTNLRHLLHELQRALPGERCLLSDVHTIQWLPDASTLDVADFESGVARGTKPDLERAVDLYRGDLLPGCYDDWIVPERERLRQACVAALERLIAFAEGDRDYEGAVNYGSQLLDRDPCREATYRSLMRLHALRGDRAAALHTYHTCVTALRRELGVPPDPATRALHDRLLSVDSAFSAPAAQPSPLFPLVGRAAEWAQLQAIWRSASSGRPQMALVSGDAGIGKTRLVEEMECWAARHGILTASARAYLAEGELPYAPVATLLRAQPLSALEPVWLTELARLLPELLTIRPDLPQPEPLHQSWQRVRLFEALARGVLCCHSALLLILDDLQWCDHDTLPWLHYLLRFDAHAPLLILGTFRTGESTRPELQALLAALRREELIAEIELGPLDALETSTLAMKVAGQSINPAVADSLFRGSEGNPLFVVEMVQAAMLFKDGTGQPNQWSFDHSNAELAAPQPLPRKVREVLDRRLAQLSPGAREVAEQAATFGRQFTFDLLRATSGAGDDVLVGSLDELWERRIIREQDAGYDFSHDKIREATYAGLSLARRRLLHRRAAAALEAVYAGDLDAVSGHIGRHYEQAGLARLAVTCYRRAAASAQRVYANADAIQYYRRALVLLNGSPGAGLVRAELWERLGDLLHLTGQHEPARAAYRQGLAAGGSALAVVSHAGLLRKLGSVWRDEREYGHAHQAYAEASAALGAIAVGDAPSSAVAEGSDPRDISERSVAAGESAGWWQEWIELQIDTVHLQYWENEAPAAQALLDHMRVLVEQHGTPFQRMRYAIWCSMILLRRDRFMPSDGAAAYLRWAEAAQDESGIAVGAPFILFQLGFLHLWHGTLDRAHAYLCASLSLAERSEDITLQARCLTYLALIARRLGQEGEVRVRAGALLHIAQIAHMPEYIAAAHANYAWLAWRTGDFDATSYHGSRAHELWSTLPFVYAFEWQAAFPLAAAALQQNEVATAAEHACRIIGPAQQQLSEELTSTLRITGEAMIAGRNHLVRGHLEYALQLAQAEGML